MRLLKGRQKLSQMRGKKYILLALICVIVFLPLFPYIKSTSKMSCIFCEIVAGRLPQTNIVKETDEFIIFKDIKPSSKYHYLAVSKRHIESLNSLTKADETLVTNMENGLKQYFKSQAIDVDDALFGFHLPPFITVKHLHMHGIAPKSSMAFVGRLMFKPGSLWFKTVDEAHKIIEKKA